MRQDVSAPRESVLTEPTVLLPEIGPPGDGGEPPEGYGWANHPPANQGPKKAGKAVARNSRIPAPNIPLSPPPAGAGSRSGEDRPQPGEWPVNNATRGATRDSAAGKGATRDSAAVKGAAKDSAGAKAGAGAKADNAAPRAGTNTADPRRNQAIDRWSQRRNRSAAVRPAARPFIRIRGRHAAMSRRQRWERSYVRSLVLCDLLAGTAAGATAFGLRFGDEVTTYNRAYIVLSALLPVLLLVVLAVSRAYERRYLFVGTDEYQRVLRGGVGLIAGTALVSYALDLDLARSYVLVALPTAIGTSAVLRFALRKRLHLARARGQSLRRVILVGHELSIIGMARQLRRERYHGLEVVGACLPPGHDGAGVSGFVVYGTFDDVASAVEQADADTVVVLSCPELDGEQLRRLAWRLERDEVDLVVASALVDVAGARTTIRPFDGLPMLHVEHPRLHGGSRLVKEVVDRLGALALLVLFGPLLLGVALCVRVTSRGPVLFRQVRVGRDGSHFRIYKFRSMYVDAEARLAELRHLNEHDGVLFKIRDDPRVTPVGRYLRRFSLDELPQLLNVVLGQMSLVGPRPPLPAEVAAYADDVRRRLAVKPGMTGLWQVSGRSDLPWEEAVRLDLRYVENWSLSLDLVILLRTMTAVVRSSGAY
ncbi:sugar transferase [Paractinoplanes atraurantiacus]|uniref:Undecaprenyl-phosphate galactose phosphotransferase, WbaP/exopolysaccharide biosynthesis polyprenyl glycosylphosphotransferase n=1 Tax=Paractinoplanes atraurantiacus TaxID=1036182 RepID=A0A285F3B9_9ACTN|nr:sugar transferase [Actinoplanes atraurantiacus]SNY05762.1 Undecaprenyl-phosphate galactose phosphotransferase, WbaP/exopolysaccharide biosynthesis polyprenyl glycosylphosphotransferase [Actinoplanes atraurantiacus]